MADPTLQTYCCHHHVHTADMAVRIMREFDTNAYNAVCMVSSIVGILGASYQIFPRQEDANARKWFAFSATRGRKIITWLAVSDLLASIGVFMRSLIWFNNNNIMPGTNDTASVIFCSVTSAWIQYFYTATWIWTLCYAIDMRFILSDKEECTKKYHLAAWLIPSFTTAIGLTLLYYPNADCHTARKFSTAILRILPNYLMTYCPIAIVMIANPCLYLYSSRDMEKIITYTSGQFTSRERDIIHSIKMKFLSINIVFYVCWMPNLINGILLWTLWFHLPVKVLTSIWYIMAFMNPLQAFFNCLVYRRWSFKWRSMSTITWNKDSSSVKAEEEEETASVHSTPHRYDEVDEHLPLLQGFKRTSSINGFKNYE